MESPAEMLARARLEAGLTQQQVADSAGLPQSAISAYESGKRQPTVPTLTRLLAASGHDLVWDIALQIDLDVERPFTGPVGRRVQRHRAALRELLATEGFGNPQVFGSVSRNEDRPDSDLDLLVDLPQGVGLRYFAVQDRMANLVGTQIDLAHRSDLKTRIATHIEKDLVNL